MSCDVSCDMSYEQALEYIHSVKWQGAKPGLERTRELLSRLGEPQRGLRFVHIAGTNGKGSTAACCASILRCAGYRTGLYTSPFITRFNERLQVDGAEITDARLAELVARIRPHAEAMADPPTEFELITALGMLYFLEERCDIVVLEVGMGGELDSTNVIDTPEVAVITAIGLDHTRELGPTLGAVAGAKAGIIKPGGLTAAYGGCREITDVFERRALAVGARVCYADFSRLDIHGCDLEACRFGLRPYGDVALPLIGTYQPQNAVLAVTAAELLRERGWRISDADIVRGLSVVRWPGRFEILRREPVFVLDGAHNPQGVEATLRSVAAHFGDKKPVFVLGVMADKDVESMARLIAPMASECIAVRPRSPRSMEPETLASILAAQGVPAEPFPTIRGGVEEAIRRAGRDGVVVAMGSLYFSADVRGCIDK